jgi:hypothetical protein
VPALPVGMIWFCVLFAWLPVVIDDPGLFGLWLALIGLAIICCWR